MNGRTPHREPEKLARDPALGPLLERANDAYRAGLDEAKAFQRLSERIEPRRSRANWQRFTIGAAALSFAAGIVVVLELPRHEPNPVAFGPEIPTARRANPPAEHEPAANALSADDATPRADDATPRADDQLDADPLPPPTRPAARKLETNGNRERGPQHDAPSSLTRANDNRIDCLDLARKGDSKAAERCFSERASGTGLSAEMALYEMARLRRDVLRDANGALSALDDYRQRFPQGSLRHEVSITRVELLSDVGKSREALNESETLLASASGQERAAELHLLRGNIFRHDLSDFKSATAEYAKAEALGGALAAEANRLQGASLESLGDADGAIAAYRRYLARGDASRKADVTRRIQALTTGASTGAAASAGAENPKPSR
jgi:hypothetical protein